ncbi:MAG: DUF1761 domain-containing protein [Marinoscillum sp.]
MTDISQLNFLAIFVAAVSTFLLGGLWYAPFLFGKAWMKENNFSEDDLKDGTARIFGGSFVLAVFMAFNLAAFIGTEADISFGIFAGLAAGLGWVAFALGITYLFERKSFKLWAINAGYHTIAFTIMGAILGAWH